MNIYITLDYELFFGKESGDIDDCIIRPTNELLKIVNPYNIKLVFFVDVGYLIKLNEYRTSNPSFIACLVIVSGGPILIDSLPV